MAVLLNDLFFEPSDPFTSSINVAFAFCSTYLLRPVGAVLFGWIGDNIGRRHTVIITTAMMSISCVVMATLPTYAEIGVTASVVVTICRMIQGMSSMGEIVGATLYVTEITKPPIQYPAVSTIGIFGNFGTFTALAVASLVTSTGFNWRIAFWIGAIVAVVGAVARTKLRETPEFADAKLRIKNKESSNTIAIKRIEFEASFKKLTKCYFIKTFERNTKLRRISLKRINYQL
jgi:MFS family permease